VAIFSHISKIELKIPKISSSARKELISDSLRKFGLDPNTKLKYLSGGEKRKLSLATEVS
jgi:ABC-type multidrug transport system ATPase subunit